MSLPDAIRHEELIRRCFANDCYMSHLLVPNGTHLLDANWPVGLLNAVWDKAHDNTAPPELALLIHQRIPWPVRCALN